MNMHPISHYAAVYKLLLTMHYQGGWESELGNPQMTLAFLSNLESLICTTYVLNKSNDPYGWVIIPGVKINVKYY